MNNFSQKYGHDPRLWNDVENMVRHGNHGTNQVHVNATPEVVHQPAHVEVNTTPVHVE